MADTFTTFVCTAKTPWSTAVKVRGFVAHPDAREVGDQEDGGPAGDVVTMECPHCRHGWKQELPQ